MEMKDVYKKVKPFLMKFKEIASPIFWEGVKESCVIVRNYSVSSLQDHCDRKLNSRR